jgi:NADH:ubiquinone oxidoreductase subunit 3 (subunit A)
MTQWLLNPPVAFAMLLLVVFLIYLWSRGLAFRPSGDAPGKKKLYACGEDLPIRRVQPDYSQFFPFAFFFTIMHVVALILATIPKGEVGAHGVGLVYVVGAIVALLILFRN